MRWSDLEKLYQKDTSMYYNLLIEPKCNIVPDIFVFSTLYDCFPGAKMPALFLIKNAIEAILASIAPEIWNNDWLIVISQSLC